MADHSFGDRFPKNRARRARILRRVAVALIIVGLLAGVPGVVAIWATMRAGDQACSYQIPPEGTIVDESSARQPQADVVPVPALLFCSYVSASGGKVYVYHDLGVAVQMVSFVLIGLGVVAIITARRRDNRHKLPNFSNFSNF